MSISYLVDSGATCRVIQNSDGMIDVKTSSTNITVGNKTKANAKVEGRLILQEAMTNAVLDLKKTFCVPGFHKNILSVSKLLLEGHKLEFADQTATILTPAGTVIKLERGQDNMFYLRACRVTLDQVHVFEQGGGSEDDEQWRDPTVELNDDGEPKVERKETVVALKSVYINDFHDKCGHKGEKLIKKTCSHLGINVTGTIASCEGCGMAKAKQ
jgi:hypothetical protein